MTEKITPLPLDSESRQRLDRRQGIVRCQVTDYWLRFQPWAEKYAQGTFVITDVMAGDPEGESRRVCEVVLSRDELLALLQSLPVREHD
ncbi:MAG TPA: hypothetical protein VF859_11525 [Burkholderiales bacterium]